MVNVVMLMQMTSEIEKKFDRIRVLNELKITGFFVLQHTI